MLLQEDLISNQVERSQLNDICRLIKTAHDRLDICDKLTVRLSAWINAGWAFEIVVPFAQETLISIIVCVRVFKRLATIIRQTISFRV